MSRSAYEPSEAIISLQNLLLKSRDDFSISAYKLIDEWCKTNQFDLNDLLYLVHVFRVEPAASQKVINEILIEGLANKWITEHPDCSTTDILKILPIFKESYLRLNAIKVWCDKITKNIHDEDKARICELLATDDHIEARQLMINKYISISV